MDEWTHNGWIDGFVIAIADQLQKNVFHKQTYSRTKNKLKLEPIINHIKHAINFHTFNNFLHMNRQLEFLHVFLVVSNVKNWCDGVSQFDRQLQQVSAMIQTAVSYHYTFQDVFNRSWL